MKIKSVKYINPFISVIQTIYDIATKGHGGVAIAIGMNAKVRRMKGLHL